MWDKKEENNTRGRKGKCKEFESSYTLLPRGEGAEHKPLLDWTQMGCKRGTRLQFVLVERRVVMSLSPVYSILLDQDHRLSLYTPSPLCWPPLLLLGMPGLLPKISLNRTNPTFQSKLASGGGQYQAAMPSVTNHHTPLDRCCASVGISISISLPLLSFFSPARSTGYFVAPLHSRREIRGCGLGHGNLGRNFAG